MSPISVIAEIGEVCADPEDGAKLYSLIRRDLTSGQAAVVDFDGVRVLTSAFLNAAIGAQLERTSLTDFRARVQILNVDDTDAALIDVVLENAAAYYEADRMGRERLVSITDPQEI